MSFTTDDTNNYNTLSEAWQLRHVGPPATIEDSSSTISLSVNGSVTIGRGPTADYFLDSKIHLRLISRVHASVTGESLANGHVKFFIKNYGLNGTYINDFKLGTNDGSKKTLHEGDKVVFGHTNSGSIQVGTYAPQPQSEFQFVFEKVELLEESHASLKQCTTSSSTPDLAFENQFPSLVTSPQHITNPKHVTSTIHITSPKHLTSPKHVTSPKHISSPKNGATSARRDDSVSEKENKFLETPLNLSSDSPDGKSPVHTSTNSSGNKDKQAVQAQSMRIQSDNDVIAQAYTRGNHCQSSAFASGLRYEEEGRNCQSISSEEQSSADYSDSCYNSEEFSGLSSRQQEISNRHISKDVKLETDVKPDPLSLSEFEKKSSHSPRHVCTKQHRTDNTSGKDVKNKGKSFRDHSVASLLHHSPSLTEGSETTEKCSTSIKAECGAECLNYRSKDRKTESTKVLNGTEHESREFYHKLKGKECRLSPVNIGTDKTKTVVGHISKHPPFEITKSSYLRSACENPHSEHEGKLCDPDSRLKTTFEGAGDNSPSPLRCKTKKNCHRSRGLDIDGDLHHQKSVTPTKLSWNDNHSNSVRHSSIVNHSFNLSSKCTSFEGDTKGDHPLVKVEKSPTKNYSLDKSLTKNCPLNKSSFKNHPMEKVPTNNHPMEKLPTKNHPMEKLPTNNHPMEKLTIKHHPQEQSPTRNPPLEKSFTKNQSHEKSFTKNHGLEKTPNKNHPREQSPTKNHPPEKSSTKYHPQEKRPIKNYPLQPSLSSSASAADIFVSHDSLLETNPSNSDLAINVNSTSSHPSSKLSSSTCHSSPVFLPVSERSQIKEPLSAPHMFVPTKAGLFESSDDSSGEENGSHGNNTPCIIKKIFSSFKKLQSKSDKENKGKDCSFTLSPEKGKHDVHRKSDVKVSSLSLSGRKSCRAKSSPSRHSPLPDAANPDTGSVCLKTGMEKPATDNTAIVSHVESHVTTLNLSSPTASGSSSDEEPQEGIAKTNITVEDQRQSNTSPKDIEKPVKMHDDSSFSSTPPTCNTLSKSLKKHSKSKLRSEPSKVCPVSHDAKSDPPKVCPISHSAKSEPSKVCPVLHGTKSKPSKVCPISHIAKSEPSKVCPKLHDTKSEPSKVCPKLHDTKSEPSKVCPKLHDTKSEPSKACPLSHSTKSKPSKVCPISHDVKSEPSKACPKSNNVKSEPSKASSISHGTKSKPSIICPISNIAKSEPSKACPKSNNVKSEPSKASSISHGTKSKPSKICPISNIAKSEPSKVCPISPSTKSEPSKICLISHSAKSSNIGTKVPSQEAPKMEDMAKKLKQAKIELSPVKLSEIEELSKSCAGKSKESRSSTTYQAGVKKSKHESPLRPPDKEPPPPRKPHWKQKSHHSNVKEVEEKHSLNTSTTTTVKAVTCSSRPNETNQVDRISSTSDVVKPRFSTSKPREKLNRNKRLELDEDPVEIIPARSLRSSMLKRNAELSSSEDDEDDFVPWSVKPKSKKSKTSGHSKAPLPQAISSTSTKTKSSRDPPSRAAPSFSRNTRGPPPSLSTGKRHPAKRKRSPGARDNSSDSDSADRKRKRHREDNEESWSLPDGVQYFDNPCSAIVCIDPSGKAVNWVMCDRCEQWYHLVCVDASLEDVENENTQFVCGYC